MFSHGETGIRFADFTFLVLLQMLDILLFLIFVNVLSKPIVSLSYYLSHQPVWLVGNSIRKFVEPAHQPYKQQPRSKNALFGCVVMYR